MDFSKLSYAQVREYSASLKTNASKMSDILNNVKIQFNKIGTDGVWSGTAASQTKEEFDALAAKFNSFHEAVTSCATYLDQVVANYESVDRVLQGK